MAREWTIDDLMERRQAMLDLMLRLPSETDPERITALAHQLALAARELEELAKAFERQELAKAPPRPRGSFEVVLTDAQRRRVEQATGVTLEILVVRDDSGVLCESMPHTDPARIEALAIAEGHRQRISASGHAQIRQRVDALVAAIEAQGTGEVKQLIARLKRDPRWLGGLLFSLDDR